jgi:hypothetical protein
MTICLPFVLAKVKLFCVAVLLRAAPGFCGRIVLAENRFPLFRTML